VRNRSLGRELGQVDSAVAAGGPLGHDRDRRAPSGSLVDHVGLSIALADMVEQEIDSQEPTGCKVSGYTAGGCKQRESAVVLSKRRRLNRFH
jgi:hypothetical protein